MKICIRALVCVGSLALYGCTGGGAGTDTQTDQDGQIFAAKPGLARLYIIHGSAKTTETDSGYAPSPRTNLQALAGLTGALVKIAIDSDQAPIIDPTDPDDQYIHLNPRIAEDYSLNGKRLGKIRYGEYFALDLPAGHYAVSAFQVRAAGTEPFDQTVIDLQPGQVAYLYSSMWVSSHAKSTELVVCDAACQPLVLASQRVAVP